MGAIGSHLFVVVRRLVGDDLLDELVVAEATDHSGHVPLLGVRQPAVIQGDVEQVKDDARVRVLEGGDAGKLDVDVESGLELGEQRDRVVHVLGCDSPIFNNYS
jgi:hypothetical protein